MQQVSPLTETRRNKYMYIQIYIYIATVAGVFRGRCYFINVASGLAAAAGADASAGLGQALYGQGMRCILATNAARQGTKKKESKGVTMMH